MCGKKVTVIRSQTINEGSPPPVRGKDTGGGLNLPVAGITPACAGKRLTCINDSAFREDHPRVCGEKRLCSRLECFCLGSPPRVRGKVPLFLAIFIGFGITPACAGKSCGGSPAHLLAWDHPRVCGEKLSDHEPGDPGQGSPPRVRGKVLFSPMFFPR